MSDTLSDALFQSQTCTSEQIHSTKTSGGRKKERGKSDDRRDEGWKIKGGVGGWAMGCGKKVIRTRFDAPGVAVLLPGLEGFDVLGFSFRFSDMIMRWMLVWRQLAAGFERGCALCDTSKDDRTGLWVESFVGQSSQGRIAIAVSPCVISLISLRFWRLE